MAIENFLVPESELAKLKLYDPGDNEIPIPTPTNYLTLTRDDLLSNNEKIDSLVECYQKVFGSDELGLDGKILWGEGAFCSGGCGTIIDRSRYNELDSKGDLGCDKPSCKGKFEEYHSKEKVLERLEHELTEGENPLATLMLNDEGDVVGFAWGSILQPNQLRERIVQARFPEDQDAGRRAVDTFIEGIGDRRVLFMDEFAIRKYARKGFSPVQHLARPSHEQSLSRDVDQAVFWTKPPSPIFPITAAFGYRPEYSTQGQIVYMRNHDTKPLVKVLQNMNETQISVYLKKFFKSEKG